MNKDTFIYKEVDGLGLAMDCYRGSTDAAILWIHGGGFIGGGREDVELFRYQLTAYLEEGYSFFAVDYRLAPESRLRDGVSDIVDAVSWIHANGPAILGKSIGSLFVAGFSAGGCLALVAGNLAGSHVKAIVSIYGYGNPLADWYRLPDEFYNTLRPISDSEARKYVGSRPIGNATGLYDRYNFYIWCRQTGSWISEVIGDEPFQDEARAKFCPANDVSSVFPPTLLIHGDADTDVPCHESVAMAETFRKAGVCHDLVIVKGAGHLFDAEENGKAPLHGVNCMTNILAFLRNNL